MCPEVRHQVGLPFKLFLTHLTLMHHSLVLSPHFLSQVDALVVDVQVVGASETLSALFTLMSSLTCVDLPVFLEMIVSYESFATFLTLIALIVMVNTKMQPV